MATAKAFDTYVDGLNDILRAFRKLPKEASAEMRVASQAVADKHMAPAWRNAALRYAGPWGEGIAGSVRAKKDRVPAVSIGYKKKIFSGGASSITVRYPSDMGNRGKAGPYRYTDDGPQGTPVAFGEGSNWMVNVKNYKPAAMQEWTKAVDRIVMKWGTF